MMAHNLWGRLTGGAREMLAGSSHTRRAKAILYAVTALYMIIGLVVGVSAALSGDRIDVFVGFLLITGAMGIAALGSLLFRLTTRVARLGEHIADIQDRLSRIAPAADSYSTPIHEESSAPLMDLAAIGKGNPSELAAARLDRDVLPRLVTLMEDKPPPEACETQERRTLDALSAEPAAQRVGREEDRNDTCATAAAFKNLSREWKLALRHGDLAACRAVFAAFADTLDPSTLAPLELQLRRLADRTEESLRKAFTDSLHRRDYAGMLMVGERICKLLPDRQVAEEFKRIRLQLMRGPLRETEGSTPTLRVVE